MQTGKIEEIMLLQCPEDLEKFRKMYGITGEIEKEYGCMNQKQRGWKLCWKRRSQNKITTETNQKSPEHEASDVQCSGLFLSENA